MRSVQIVSISKVYGGRLRKRCVLSLEWKREGVIDGDRGGNDSVDPTFVGQSVCYFHYWRMWSYERMHILLLLMLWKMKNLFILFHVFGSSGGAVLTLLLAGYFAQQYLPPPKPTVIGIDLGEVLKLSKYFYIFKVFF